MSRDQSSLLRFYDDPERLTVATHELHEEVHPLSEIYGQTYNTHGHKIEQRAASGDATIASRPFEVRPGEQHYADYQFDHAEGRRAKKLYGHEAGKFHAGRIIIEKKYEHAVSCGASQLAAYYKYILDNWDSPSPSFT